MVRVGFALPVAGALFGMMAMASTGCSEVELTEVRVKDAGAVGVVSKEDGRWLLPPHSPPGKVDIYSNVATTETLSRAPSGDIGYAFDYWALGPRHLELPLMDAQGRMGWAGAPGGSGWLPEAMSRDGDVELHGYYRRTGTFGGGEPVRMALATDGRNIQEVDLTRSRIRWLGIGEIALGGVALGFAAADGAVALPAQPSEARSIALGVGVGVVVLGGLLLGNGLWRALTPDRRIEYYAAN